MEQKTKKATKGSTKTTKKTVMDAINQEPKLTDYSFSELLTLANNKFRAAQRVLGNRVRHDKIEIDNAIDDLKMAAILGHPEAQYELAYKYIIFWTGPLDNVAEGVLWCQRSALNGFAKAQKMLGDYYRRGQYGIKQDLERAFNLYQKAAEGGNADGYLALAGMYKKGEYVEVDYQEALRLYTIAEEISGNGPDQTTAINAANGLAEMYLHGLGTAPNGTQAALYYIDNAQRGDSVSAYNAAEIYYHGIAGVEKNISEAIKWYTMASSMVLSCPRAKLKLAMIYEAGEGVPSNLSLALKYYKLVMSDDEMAYNDFGEGFEDVFFYVKKKIANLEKQISEAQSPTES